MWHIPFDPEVLLGGRITEVFILKFIEYCLVHGWYKLGDDLFANCEMQVREL